MKRKLKMFLFIMIAMVLCMSITANASGKWWKINVGKAVISNGFTFKELENRKGKLYIEITTGKVVKNGGHGKENVPRGKQNYIKYPNKYKKGTKMMSVIVYNPDTNATDDILFIHHMKR